MNQHDELTKLISDLIEMLRSIRMYVTDDSDMVWTPYDAAEELRSYIDTIIEDLQLFNRPVLLKIDLLFAPTGTFQEHAIQNGWSDEYLALSSNFNVIYRKMMSMNPNLFYKIDD